MRRLRVIGLLVTVFLAAGCGTDETPSDGAVQADNKVVGTVATVPTDDAANGIIMAARAHWFEDDETPEETGEAEVSGGAGNPKEDAED